MSKAGVIFLDPRSAPAMAPDSYEPRLGRDLVAPVIGILANGFVDSDVFGAHLGDAITRVRPGTRIVLENKGDPSTVVRGDQADRMLEQCDAIIGLYGH